MTVPEGAVGQDVDVYLAVLRDDKDRPKLTGSANLSVSTIETDIVKQLVTCQSVLVMKFSISSSYPFSVVTQVCLRYCQFSTVLDWDWPSRRCKTPLSRKTFEYITTRSKLSNNVRTSISWLSCGRLAAKVHKRSERLDPKRPRDVKPCSLTLQHLHFTKVTFIHSIIVFVHLIFYF